MASFDITATEVMRRQTLWGKELQRILEEGLLKDFLNYACEIAEKEVLPKLTLQEAMVGVAIAVVLKNPETTRRHLFNIFRMSDE